MAQLNLWAPSEEYVDLECQFLSLFKDVWELLKKAGEKLKLKVGASLGI